MINLTRSYHRYMLGYVRREQAIELMLLGVPRTDWPDKEVHLDGDFLRCERRGFKIAYVYHYDYIYNSVGKRPLRLCR